MAGRAAVTEWNELLAETRQALSTLRAEDLELLTVRAEEMLAVTSVCASRIDRGECRGLGREHRLLGHLLTATDRNIEVLRRLRGGACGRSSAGGIDLRWVR